MKHIGLLPFKFDPAPLRAELLEHPELWDEITHRTEHPKSPHREVSDIWLRYNDIENFKGDMATFNGPHESVWYPAVRSLPSVKPLVYRVAKEVEAQSVGGILITKVPAGKQVYPHIDQGWHAGHYQKVALQIQGNESQGFCYEDGRLSAVSGQAYQFHNHVPHWVVNDSDEDRVTLIITLTSEYLCH